MGFVLDTVHRLVFEEFIDDDGEALEIRVKPLALGRWIQLREGRLTPVETVDLFVEHLLGWNLQNRGEDGQEVDVPADAGGVRSQDLTFVLQLMTLWTERIYQVPAPLGQSSTSGPPSLEESIPMEASSPSPPSSSTPS